MCWLHLHFQPSVSLLVYVGCESGAAADRSACFHCQQSSPLQPTHRAFRTRTNSYLVASTVGAQAFRPHAVSSVTTSRFGLASKATVWTMTSTAVAATANENGAKGAFQRAETVWRNWIGEGVYPCPASLWFWSSCPLHVRSQQCTLPLIVPVNDPHLS